MFILNLSKLPSIDQNLVSAFASTGLALEDLAYSTQFEKLCDRLGSPKTLSARQAIYRRLLYLHRRGRLPQQYAPEGV